MGTNGVPFFALGGKSSSQSEFRRENSFDVTYRKLRQAPQNYFKKVAFHFIFSSFHCYFKFPTMPCRVPKFLTTKSVLSATPPTLCSHKQVTQA